jgi:hypothetical protein
MAAACTTRVERANWQRCQEDAMAETVQRKRLQAGSEGGVDLL